MSYLIKQSIDFNKIEKQKIEGNELFNKKKYLNALNIYKNSLNDIYHNLFNTSDGLSNNIKEIVIFFVNNEKNSIKSENEKLKTEKDNEKGENINIEKLKQIFSIICHNVALCYYYLEEFDNSIEYCNYVQQLNKNHIKSYNTLGMCYEKKKNYDESIKYYERCKQFILNDSSNKDNQSEIKRIHEKIKNILKILHESKNIPNNYNFDEIKNILENETKTVEEKLNALFKISEIKYYLIHNDKIIQYLFNFINKITTVKCTTNVTTLKTKNSNTTLLDNSVNDTTDNINSNNKNSEEKNDIVSNNLTNTHEKLNYSKENNEKIRLEKMCFYVLQKIISKKDINCIKTREDKDNIQKTHIESLEYEQFDFYYDIEFLDILCTYNNIFSVSWIFTYVKKQMKELDNLKFCKEKENIYKEILDILLCIICMIKYMYVINNEEMLKIINLYLNSDIDDLSERGLYTVDYICQKKKKMQEMRKQRITKEFTLELEKRKLDDKNQYIIDYHLSDISKYPLCVSNELKKLIENTISLHEKYLKNVIYTLILIFSLLSDKCRSKDKDTEMNILINETADLYFDYKKIHMEWFVYVKSLYFVDKNIILNYLIGKPEYLIQLMIFIRESIGREPEKNICFYIDVFLLILSINELRELLKEHIEDYIDLLNSTIQNSCYIQLLVGAFKLYIHNTEFKNIIKEKIDLFNCAHNLLENQYIVLEKNYVQGENLNDNKEKNETKKEIASNSKSKIEKANENEQEKRLDSLNTLNTNVTKSNNQVENVNFKILDNIINGTTKDAKQNKDTYYNLKNITELLMHLSLHIEFKKKFLERKYHYFFIILIKLGKYINSQKENNVIKYQYCVIINNLIMTNNDEKKKRRELNKMNLSNFDPEQIEALEQFYDKMPHLVTNKPQTLIDYGDEKSSKEMMSLLLHNENFQNNLIQKEKYSLKKNNFKNGIIIQIILNFMNKNFFTDNIAEIVCEILSKFVAERNYTGLIVVNGGLKVLLDASKYTKAKTKCAEALAEIFIAIDPKLVNFYEAYDALPILIKYISSDNKLTIYKMLMAITNILTIDENIAIKAVNMNLWNLCFNTLTNEDDYLRTSALECIHNLCCHSYLHQFICEKYENVEKLKGNKTENSLIEYTDMQILFAFTLEFNNPKAMQAVASALSILSTDSRLALYFIRTKNFNHVYTCFEKTDNQQVLYHILSLFKNILETQNIPHNIIQEIKTCIGNKQKLNNENLDIVKHLLS